MTNAATQAPAKEAKILTVIDNMDSRRIFDTAEEATAYIQKCQIEYVDFAGYPVAAVGLTDAGELDPEIYTPLMRIAVAVLTQRANSAMNPTDSSRVQCIVIYPAPKLSAILGLPESESLESSTALTWLQGVLDTEINHVAVRNLRKAANASEIADAIESMPKTLADYVTSGRESTSGILETFNQLWQIIKKGIGAKSKAFALQNFSKKELRRAMESASYAATVYPQIETRVNKKGEPESLFEVAAQFGLVLAKKATLDTTIFDRMIENRDEKEIEVTDESDEDFDFEVMAAKVAAPATTPTAGTEGAFEANPDLPPLDGDDSQEEANGEAAAE